MKWKRPSWQLACIFLLLYWLLLQYININLIISFNIWKQLVYTLRSILIIDQRVFYFSYSTRSASFRMYIILYIILNDLQYVNYVHFNQLANYSTLWENKNLLMLTKSFEQTKVLINFFIYLEFDLKYVNSIKSDNFCSILTNFLVSRVIIHCTLQRKVAPRSIFCTAKNKKFPVTKATFFLSVSVRSYVYPLLEQRTK